MVELLGGIFKFLVLIFGEYFSARARAREKQEKFEINEAKFQELVNNAMERMRELAKKESAGAGNAWDAADKDQGGKS